MKDRRIQIVGRLPQDLSRRVRAAARKQKQTLNGFLIGAFDAGVGAITSRGLPRAAHTLL